MAIKKLKTKFALGSFINNVKTFYEKMNEIIQYLTDNPTPTPSTPAWIKKAIFLTQAEVRTLRTANGSYGYEIFDAQGANIFVEFSNPMILFDHSGGTFPLALLEIYSANSATDLWQMNNNADGGGAGGDNQRVYHFYKNPGTGAVRPPMQELNDKMYLYAADNLDDYEGTATFVFDYRIINITIITN